MPEIVTDGRRRQDNRQICDPLKMEISEAGLPHLNTSKHSFQFEKRKQFKILAQDIDWDVLQELWLFHKCLNIIKLYMYLLLVFYCVL